MAHTPFIIASQGVAAIHRERTAGSGERIR
jgi:hypothetical protein